MVDKKLQNTNGPKAIRFLTVLGDDIIEMLLLTTLTVLTFLVVSGSTIGSNRLFVALIYSIGGDIGIKLLVNRSTALILKQKLKKGVVLRSLGDYLSIISRPKAQFSFSHLSRLIAVIVILLRDHLVEQSLNYVLPTEAQPIDGLRSTWRPLLSPLGGGKILETDRQTFFRSEYASTGLSFIARDIKQPSTDVYFEYERDVYVFHHPEVLYQSKQQTVRVPNFDTILYKVQVQPIDFRKFDQCRSTSQLTDCVKRIEKIDRELSWRGYMNGDNMVYEFSMDNTNPKDYGRPWSYRATISRRRGKMGCIKTEDKISCEMKKINEAVRGKWMDVDQHMSDMTENMLSCFLNIASFNYDKHIKQQELTLKQLVQRLAVASLIRSAFDKSETGPLAFLSLSDGSREKDVTYFKVKLSYRGHPALMALVVLATTGGIIATALYYIIGTEVPETVMAIAAQLGDVVTTNSLACVSEKKRAIEGIVSADKNPIVFQGVATENGKIVLEPNMSEVDGYSTEVAHLIISTEDKISNVAQLGGDILCAGKSKEE